MTSRATQIIRLAVAAGIAYLVALAAKQGLPTLGAAQQDAVVTAIVAIAAPLYTGIVKYLEARFPFLGYLLGARIKKQPGTLGSNAQR